MPRKLSYFPINDSILVKIVTGILLLILTTPFTGSCQDELEYDEISIMVNIKGAGEYEIPALIRNEILYLSISDFFNSLKIKNNSTLSLDSNAGFFINPEADFLFDKAHDRILYKDKIFELHPTDLINTGVGLYLNSNYFSIFGLHCKFDFRNLSASLISELELPLIREMRLSAMRNNIHAAKGNFIADTNLVRTQSLFHFGVADWSILGIQESQRLPLSRLNLQLGGIFAGGETTVSLNYFTNQAFSEKQQYYLWRYVNNDHPLVKQVSAGKIYSPHTSSIYAPILGFQFSNTPTTNRKSFGSYRLTDFTEPGWIVELYMNNVLVNYTKADASGLFSFEVPLMYGNSLLKLRFYGPWGEERIREQSMNIPFNFLPAGEFEYTMAAGVVEDGNNSRYSRLALNYGINNLVTASAGVEYLSSVSTGKTMPFLKLSVRPVPKMIITAEHTYRVRSKAVLNYRFATNLQLEMNYTKYAKDQKAIFNNYLEERKVLLSFPVTIGRLVTFSRLSLNQIVLPFSKYTYGEHVISFNARRLNTNLTTNAFISGVVRPSVYSNLALNYRFQKKLAFKPQLQYDYSKKMFTLVRSTFEKYIFSHGFVNVSYEANFYSKTNSFGLGLRYDFSFAQTSFSIRQSQKTTSMVESARGSFLYDAHDNYSSFSNRANIGKGGILVIAFLDVNRNGKRDAGEPKADGLNFRVNGGRTEFNKKDTSFRVFDLEAYTNYLIRIDENSFENIAWQIKKHTINVEAEPNNFKLVEIPVLVMAEASGNVYVKGQNGNKGLGRITVHFVNSDSTSRFRAVTESDGFFSFLGLAPGTYKVKLDDAQLKKLHLKATPSELHFRISVSKEGDFIDGLDFILENTSGAAPEKISENAESN